MLLGCGLGLAGLLLFVLCHSAALTRMWSPPADFMVEGRVCCDEVPAIAWLAQEASVLPQRAVVLTADDEQVSRSLAELGFSLDVEATASVAERLPRAEGWLARARRAFGPPLTPPVLSAQWRFDGARARATLEELAQSLNQPALNAVADARTHRWEQERRGRVLDVEASLLALSRVRDVTAEPLTALLFERLAPRTRLADLSPVDVSLVAGSFETDFRGKAGARALNIRRAAELLDGFVLAPHARFSFNRVVGPREKERGFVEAPVIVNDELEAGLGGGVCQVATTLHAAARFAGMVVTERRSHSRPSGYAPLGLDATVIDGKVDLRFENPFDSPLMIQAYLPSATRIRVEFLGRAADARVEHRYQVIERHPFLRRVVDKPSLAPGTFERTQKGNYGYEIMSVVTRTDAAGRVQTVRYASKYYPVPEVFALGAGTPLSALPELPRGATGVEPEPTRPEP